MAERTRPGRGPKSYLRRLLIVLALILIVRRWICSPALVTGGSMSPGLRSGQVGLINKLAYSFHPPKRGDIVAVWTGKELWVKRILGLPGEEVEVRDGVLYIDSARVEEHYVSLQDCSTISAGTLGPDQYVVAGDNRQFTSFVIVRRDRILGRFSPL